MIRKCKWMGVGTYVGTSPSNRPCVELDQRSEVWIEPLLKCNPAALREICRFQGGIAPSCLAASALSRIQASYYNRTRADLGELVLLEST